MAANRCTICAINYPANQAHRLCDFCCEQTFYLSNDEPDIDWSQQVLKLKMAEEEAAGKLADPIPVIEGEVRLHHDEMFISSYDVINSGVLYELKEGTIIRVRKMGFEVRSYSAERREYWIRPFELHLTQDEFNAYFPTLAIPPEPEDPPEGGWKKLLPGR